MNDRSARAQVVAILDEFPVLSETFVTSELVELERQGHRVIVEAGAPPQRLARDGLGLFTVNYLAGTAPIDQLRALLWLIRRAPRGVARDLRARKRWTHEEPIAPLRRIATLARRIDREPAAVLYCHFAAAAALNTMRVAALLGRRYALVTHAYDIYKTPANLAEKLAGADPAMTISDYNVRALATLAPGVQVQRVTMGVDPELWRRRRPLPGGRTVIGVGRLVEKKGFTHLVDAIVAVPDANLVLVGDGPLREALRAQAAALGVADRVRFAGALPRDQVRAEMEAADVLAMPCVVAADGDRDGLPVVVSEAMCLELMVVASDLVGLPERVQAPWGRLVAPGDPDVLARALGEILALATPARATAGAAGRAHVQRHANLGDQASRLAELLRLGAP